MKTNEPKISGIILSAGNSSRMKQPKQLLKYKGQLLLEHILDEAAKSRLDKVITVLGGNAQQIQAEIDFSKFEVIIHPRWEDGMTSSLQNGLKHLIENNDIEAIIILLSDQPFVDEIMINKLIDRYKKSDKTIIASRYGGTLGVPVLFDKKHFKRLLELKESDGAKKVIFENPDDVEEIDFPLGEIDIDTLDDYEKLKKSEN